MSGPFKQNTNLEDLLWLRFWHIRLGFWVVFSASSSMTGLLLLTRGVLPNQLGLAELPTSVLCTWRWTLPVSYFRESRRALDDVTLILNPILGMYVCVAKCFYQISSVFVYVLSRYDVVRLLIIRWFFPYSLSFRLLLIAKIPIKEGYGWVKTKGFTMTMERNYLERARTRLAVVGVRNFEGHWLACCTSNQKKMESQKDDGLQVLKESSWQLFMPRQLRRARRTSSAHRFHQLPASKLTHPDTTIPNLHHRRCFFLTEQCPCNPTGSGSLHQDAYIL